MKLAVDLATGWKELIFNLTFTKHWYLISGEKGADLGREMNKKGIKERRAKENNNEIIFLSFAFML